MSLSAGQKLGPYEIVGRLGAGGMGEVYRARDTRLERSVAIKIMPADVAGKEDRRARFEREARAVASLNHPHICALYDIGGEAGVAYIVMELLDGESLAKRLERGPLTIPETLRYGIEIAEALSAAHRSGVVHRDLKPGNIVLTKTGAKLLDFGLASVESHSLSEQDATTTMAITAEGSIVGTWQYMAPEQLEGKKADARSDVFAFGAVLYEMATGHRAFEGRSTASLVGAIMGADPPPISTLRPGPGDAPPPALERVIRQCLAKDPDERWQSAADLARELRWILEGGSQAGVPAPVAARRRNRERLAWTAAICLLAAAALVVALLRVERPQPRVLRFTVSLPAGTTLASSILPMVSPDGEKVLFVAQTGNDPQLWVHHFVTGDALPVRGTEGVYAGLWEPDSRSIVFSRRGKVFRLDLTTGLEQGEGEATGAASGVIEEGVDAYCVDRKGLFVQSPDGSTRLVSPVDAAQGDIAYFLPSVLPGGRGVVCRMVRAGGGAGPVFLISLESGKREQLFMADSQAVYAPPGYLLYVSGDTLMARRFDAGRAKLAGPPVSLVGSIAAIPGAPYLKPFSVSKNGVLVFRSGAALLRLSWFDRTGKLLESLGAPADYSNPALSPDGQGLAVSVRDEATQKRGIWVFDVARGFTAPITRDSSDNTNPVWSPDGSRLVFTSDRKGSRDLYVKPASFGGQETVLLESGDNKSAEDWSPDGRVLTFNRSKPDSVTGIWALPMDGAGRKPYAIETSQFTETQTRFSPDGKWLAWASGETGQFEVFVQPFPPTGARYQVSNAGGMEPQWRGDGKELFYVAGSKLMSVEVRTAGGKFAGGIPQALFETRLAPLAGRNRYLASRDGRKLLILTPVQDESGKAFTAIVNWPLLLGKQAQ
jgi:Tol biopolymer transport system component